MNEGKYSTLMEALVAVPDPRKARGKRHVWLVLLTVLVAGLASGQQTAHAIAQWLHLHAEELRSALPGFTRVPSESTLLRTLRLVDVGVLETAVARLTQPHSPTEQQASQVITPCGTRLNALAVDGKALRGATTCGAPTHLVSVVQHGTGTTLAQSAVAAKRNEISAVPLLLKGRDLTDTIVTMDALLTQRTIAQQIIDQGGHYLMVVKGNQPQLRDALALFFDLPAIAADHERWDRVCRVTKGHGRLETRSVECTTGDGDFLGWPGATHAVRRICERQILTSGKTSRRVTHAITNLPQPETSAAVLDQVWRGHWTIESRSHYVRDVTLGEDANHMHTGHAPQVLAALRNGLLALWRRDGWTNLADAVRATAVSIPTALTFIGLASTLT